MNLPNSSCSMKDKDRKSHERIFKYNQDVLMPGFRFHPTEEELVEFYLRRKVEGKHFNIELITSIYLYRYDPWELPALASNGEKEWFFYVHRDRKYRNGDRPNRVTTSGYWKATGADRMIRNGVSRSIGLKKTLVFYEGKAPKGKRTSWIMNEYRLPQLETQRIQKKELSLCRVYKKPGGSEEGRQVAKEPYIRTENHEMQEWAGMHQCQSCMACSNPRMTAESESCNFEIKEGSPDEIVKLEELATDRETMSKSRSGQEIYPVHMEYGASAQSENNREYISSDGENVWSTVSRPIALHEDPELSFTTCLMIAPDQLAMAEDLYNNIPSYLVLTNGFTYGACLQPCSDKLWEWNPVRNDGDGTSC